MIQSSSNKWHQEFLCRIQTVSHLPLILLRATEDSSHYFLSSWHQWKSCGNSNLYLNIGLRNILQLFLSLEVLCLVSSS